MLINKDITNYNPEFDTLYDVVDEVLGNQFKAERDYQGTKQHMRLRWSRSYKPNMEWYSDLGHYRWGLRDRIDEYIESRVGRPFAQVFSEFKKDPRFSDKNIICDTTPATYFISQIENPKRTSRTKPETNNRYWRGMRQKPFSIDENGLLQHNPLFKTYKRDTTTLRNPIPTYVYEVRRNNIIKYQHEIISVHGYHTYRELLNGPTQAWIEKFKNDLYLCGASWKEQFGYLFKFDYSNGLFYMGGSPAEYVFKLLFESNLEYKRYNAKPGTKAYGLAQAEIKRAVAASKKKVDRSDYYDYVLYVEKERSKHPDQVPELSKCIEYGSIEQARAAEIGKINIKNI